jgi:hypothetical protein
LRPVVGFGIAPAGNPALAHQGQALAHIDAGRRVGVGAGGVVHRDRLAIALHDFTQRHLDVGSATAQVNLARSGQRLAGEADELGKRFVGGVHGLARRAAKMNPSVIREILKVTEKPGIISFAGGLPSPKTFPVAEFEAACAKVLRDDPSGALQYASSEGFGPLREMVADHAALGGGPGPGADHHRFSQQGLDLVAKVLMDAGSKMLVESPTYLGAVSAFVPMEPDIVSVDSDENGVDDRRPVHQGRQGAFFVCAAQFPEPNRAHHETNHAAPP